MDDYHATMIDHLNLAVSDVDRSCAFYTAALDSIGIDVLLNIESHRTESGGRMVGYGRGKKPFFWILDNERVGEGTHVAFAVDTHAKMEAFYEAALDAGGTDNGAPGLRPEYHENYYGAFVLDPDGINVEAVCHDPE